MKLKNNPEKTFLFTKVKCLQKRRIKTAGILEVTERILDF